MKTSVLLATLLAILSGCASLPELPPEHRFIVSCRRAADAPPERPEALVNVKARWESLYPNAQCLRGNVSLVEGAVKIEVNGWTQKGLPGQLEARVGVRPGVPFHFVLAYLGHEDEYTITVPERGDALIEPPAGEFSSAAKAP